MSPNSSLTARCGVAFVSALAYAGSFHPRGWGVLIVPAVAGLLYSLQGLRGTRARAVGFAYGMVAFGAGVPWLALLFGTFAVLLWGILAAFIAAFAWTQSLAEVRGWRGGRLAGFTLVNWCAWEFIRAELFPLKFPWMTVGLAWGPNALLPWIGVYGAGLLLVFVAASLVHRHSWRAAGAAMVTLHLTGWQLKWHVPGLEPDPEVIHVAALQFESVSVDKFIKATRELPPHVQHVLWPEYAVPYDVRGNKRDWAAMLALCQERNITLTLGTQTRPKDRQEWFNTALTLDAFGARGEHYKMHPVHFFDDGTPGTTALPVDTVHGKIGTPICFDCDYEGAVRRMTAAGAEAFIVPMMDAESWSRMQHDQHAELFRIRACENGRWFMVCGTSGVSQAIDDRGAVHAKLDAMEQGVLTSFVRRKTELTFYTRWGWLTPWCLTGIAVVCWIVLLLPQRAAKDAGS